MVRLPARRRSPPERAALRELAGPARARPARLAVTGVVQGVGFRPFVHRLALRHGAGRLGAQRRRDAVEIHVEGTPPALDAFSAALRAEAPPLARIDARGVDAGASRGRRAASSVARERATPIRRATARAARRGHLRRVRRASCSTPANRRYRLPVHHLHRLRAPLHRDRGAALRSGAHRDARLSAVRARARRSTTTPADRRFHAETNSCPECGPQLVVRVVRRRAGVATPATSQTGIDDAALRAAPLLLSAGGILALRGIGGFHLAVDATNEAAVRRLRERKQREAKPLAVHGAHDRRGRAARTVAHRAERAWLLVARAPDRAGRATHRRRRRRSPPRVAPGLDRVGVMLPSTPLHHLLLEMVGAPLVMTSGNLADEPHGRRQRRGDAPPGAHRRRASCCTTARSSRALRRFRRATGRRRRPSCCGAPAATRRCRSPAGRRARSRCWPWARTSRTPFTLVHGDAGVRQPAHRRPRDAREPRALAGGARALSRRCSASTPGRRRARPAPGYLSTRAAHDWRQAAGPIARVQHHHAHMAAVLAEHGVTIAVLGPGLRRHRLRRRTARCGARSCCVADLAGLRARRPAALRAAARRRRRRARAVAHAGRVPVAGCRRAFDAPERWPARGSPRSSGASCQQQIARVDQRPAGLLDGPAVRCRGRRCSASARSPRTRGRPRWSWRRWPGRAGGADLPFPVRGPAGRDGCSIRCRCWRRSGRATASGASTLAQLAADFHESWPRRGRRSPALAAAHGGVSDRRAGRRLLPERAPARSTHRGRAEGRGLRGAVGPAAQPQRRRRSATARRPSPRRSQWARYDATAFAARRVTAG